MRAGYRLPSPPASLDSLGEAAGGGDVFGSDTALILNSMNTFLIGKEDPCQRKNRGMIDTRRN